MTKRIAIATLVGAITFLATYFELNRIYAHWLLPNPLLPFAARLQAILFGAIGAAAAFSISFALFRP